MMPPIALPHDAKAGPTKPEVRAVLLSKLDLESTDHFVEIGSCTGAVTIEAARRAGRVTALERKEERLETTKKNVAANDVEGRIDFVRAEAPAGLPDDADAMFLGGSRNFEAVLDHALETNVSRVVMNVSRLEVAGRAADAFRDRGLLDEIVQFQVSHGYELAGATSFRADNPVYMLVGGTDAGAGSKGGSDGRVKTDGGFHREGEQSVPPESGSNKSADSVANQRGQWNGDRL